jgi:Lrp/AsnC family leucine-responsive transcriptional regulator
MLVDALDRRILEALRRDARTSYRKIAQMMGVTTPTVIARIKKLVEIGIIEGYSVKVRGEPFDGILFIISGRKARMSRKRMERVEGVKNVMTTSDGALLVLADPRASGTVRKAGSEGGVRLKAYRITSPTTHQDIRALCAYCRQPMDEALKITLGKRQYYVCCPVCARELRDRYEKLEARSGRKG